MNPPLISVVLPFFNSEKTILRSVKSVYDQVGNFSIQLIAIDDGSTDNSCSIVSEFLRLQTKIQYKLLTHSVNRGVGYARSKGINNASGEYIAFLDADDYWMKFKLWLQLSCFSTYNDDNVIIFSSYLREKDGKVLRAMKFVKSRDMRYINRIPMSSSFSSRTLIQKIEYPKQRTRNDYIFWHRLILEHHAYAVNPSNDTPLFVYGKGNGISSNKIKLIRSQFRMYREEFNYNLFQAFFGIVLNIMRAINCKLFP